MHGSEEADSDVLLVVVEASAAVAMAGEPDSHPVIFVSDAERFESLLACRLLRLLARRSVNNVFSAVLNCTLSSANVC